MPLTSGLPGATTDPASYPADWDQSPGAPGCTVEATTYRDLAGDFADAGVAIRGLSMATPRQVKPWARRFQLTYPVLAEVDAELVTALRLPTFHATGHDHLKRLTLVIDLERVIRAIQFPITGPAGSVREALAAVRQTSVGAPPSARAGQRR